MWIYYLFQRKLAAECFREKEAWKKFKDTGKIEYYLKYKKGK